MPVKSSRTDCQAMREIMCDVCQCDSTTITDQSSMSRELVRRLSSAVAFMHALGSLWSIQRIARELKVDGESAEERMLAGYVSRARTVCEQTISGGYRRDNVNAL
ncbi:hypothetical protein Tco_0664364 [Tanacetum coccineum]